MVITDSRYAQAVNRVEAALARLEGAIQARPPVDPAEVSRVASALRAAEEQNAALVLANRQAAERLEQTIGRLRGLLAT